MATPKEMPVLEDLPGRQDLFDWLHAELAQGEPERTPASLAKLLGVTQPAVSAWVAGRGRPMEGPIRETLCRLIGSQPDRWRTAKERDEAKRLAALVAPAAPEERTGDVA